MIVVTVALIPMPLAWSNYSSPFLCRCSNLAVDGTYSMGNPTLRWVIRIHNNADVQWNTLVVAAKKTPFKLPFLIRSAIAISSPIITPRHNLHKRNWGPPHIRQSMSQTVVQLSKRRRLVAPLSLAASSEEVATVNIFKTDLRSGVVVTVTERYRNYHSLPNSNYRSSLCGTF